MIYIVYKLLLFIFMHRTQINLKLFTMLSQTLLKFQFALFLNRFSISFPFSFQVFNQSFTFIPIIFYCSDLVQFYCFKFFHFRRQDRPGTSSNPSLISSYVFHIDALVFSSHQRSNNLGSILLLSRVSFPISQLVLSFAYG